MKRKFFSKTRKQIILAIPAAALMLGASHGATIGINYTLDWGPLNPTGYYSYSYAYMTTGMNVTGTAFGVPAANWNNIQLYYYQVVNNTTVIGPLTILTKANDAWGSGIGNTNKNIYGPGMVVPGNDEVTWSYLDDNVKKATNNPVYSLYSVQISGLKTSFPYGYTVQTIGVPVHYPAPNAEVTDSATFTNALIYTSLGNKSAISAVSPVMTSDAIEIYGDPPVGNKTYPPICHSTLAGFIIADAPGSGSLTLSIVGTNLVWSSGTLQSSPALGANTVWTTLNSAVSPYPFLPPTAPQMFYRLTTP